MEATSLPSASFLLSFERCPLLTRIRLIADGTIASEPLGHLPIIAEIGLAASRCGSLSPHALLWERRIAWLLPTLLSVQPLLLGILDFLGLLAAKGLHIKATESVKMARLLISISHAIRNAASNASYSASLFVISNSKRRAYVYSLPSRLINISPALEPSELDAPSV
ncbi:hypothetical protein Tco_1409475 [Tanacetum coccineum]